MPNGLGRNGSCSTRRCVVDGLEVACGEVRALGNHAVLVRRHGVRAESEPVGANRVVGNAQLDGFRLIQGSDDDRRLAEEVNGTVAGSMPFGT